MNPFELDPYKRNNPIFPSITGTPPPVAPLSAFHTLFAENQWTSKPLAGVTFDLPKKPRLFASYHHKNDQYWYNRFAGLFGKTYDLFSDTSIGRLIESDDPIYQSRKIREDHITGSSITVVLIGAETWKRKHVDWEIFATLEKKHALLGIVLPTYVKNLQNQILVPDRFYDNVTSGFAHWLHWTEQPAAIIAAISATQTRANNTALIRNGRQQLGRNLS